ncbi:MAG: Zn-ribbon domain-containing OB-fold protein [Desulfobacterales bacterium]|nr:Zn-ribbon domain-containing OB-fold protein [Desulfobacterales bacterium]
MALIERFQKTTDIGFWEGQIPMSYIYTVGRAGEKFFRELINGKIFGAKCEACNITYVPAKIFCEKCFARLEDKYLDVGTKGKVYTFTQCYETYEGIRKEKPSIVAVIQIDGTQGFLVHWLGEINFEKVCIGLPVEAVFKAKKDREGSILDIKYFKPIK